MKRLISVIIIISAVVFFSLPASADSPKIYWTDNFTDTIHRANLDGTDIEAFITGLQDPRHIAFDLSSGKIYWTAQGPPGRIQRANLDGSNIEDLLTGLNCPLGIALDIADCKIYWADPGDGKIYRANLDGTNIEDLVTSVDALDITLDLTHGKIYWTDYSIDTILRANLDGSDIEQLGITIQPGDISSIALDIESSKIYWTFYPYWDPASINRCDLDGNNNQILVTSGISGPDSITLDLPNGKMYWTDYQTNKIQRANLDGSNVEDIITNWSGPIGLAILRTPEMDYLEVEPLTGFYSSGYEGGPFTPESISYTLQKIGPNSIDWTASVTQDWLDVTPSSGTLGPNEVNYLQININSNASDLSYGSYGDSLTITNLTNGSVHSRLVQLEVIGPIIELSQSEFYFEAQQDGNNPPDQVLGISNVGGNILNWLISETCDWMSVYPTYGSSTSEVDDVNIIIDISGLPPGIYTCQLTVSSDHAENSPQIVNVELRVTGAVIELSQNEFYFEAEKDSYNPSNQILGIHNGGVGVLNWQVSETCDWLSLEPNSGSSTGEVDDVNIAVDISGLTAGIYNCQLTVSSDHADNSPQIVSVELRVVTFLIPKFKITASDGAKDDDFGRSVSISGDRCIIGASGHNESGVAISGAAYVFEWDGTSWIQQAELMATDGNNGHFGGSVDIDGDRCIVGCVYSESMSLGSGWAYIFEWNGSAWIQVAKLKPSDSTSDDAFGYDVSISGDHCIVGAENGDGDVIGSGAAYIFEWDGSDWIEMTKLTASDAKSEYRFGNAVDIDGDRCIVGDWYGKGMESYSGSAYIFECNDTDWIEQAKLIDPNGGWCNYFGYSVSISDDRCIVGSVYDDDKGYTSGSAFIFEWNDSNWIQQAKLTASDGATEDCFGHSVSINGDRCVVGATGDDDNGDRSGSAYIFEWDVSDWIEMVKLTPADGAKWDFFSGSVDSSNNRFIVGATGDDDKGSSSGSAYVYYPYRRADLDKNWFVDLYDFALLASQWLQTPAMPSADIAPPCGDGLVDNNDLAVFYLDWLTGID